MRRLSEALFSIAMTAWVGGLWAIGYLAAPALFATLPDDRSLAGLLAGKLFALIGWVGLVAGCYLLGFLMVRQGLRAFKRSAFWLVLIMLLLTAAALFGIQPIMAQLKADAWPREVMESVMRDRFVAWHGISSLLYLVQSLLGLWLAVIASRETR